MADHTHRIVNGICTTDHSVDLQVLVVGLRVEPDYPPCGRADDEDHDDTACAEEPCGAGADPYGRTAEDWARHAE